MQMMDCLTQSVTVCLQTVGDLRRFLAVCRTDLPRDCRLATAFPAAELEDDSVTLQQAGLANAVVVQKKA